MRDAEGARTVAGRTRLRDHADGSWLVGRDHEQRVLAETIDRVARGAGGAVLISGEAGIGKTRLAQHAMRAAAQRGFRTLSGRCQPLARDLAYAPIIQAFGRWLREQPDQHRSELTRGLAALAGSFVDLGLPATGTGADPLGDAALERARLFESVARLLGRIASQAPTIAVFDDLHWADTGSLRLLRYLSDDLSGLPVLMVVTYRPEEVTDPPRGFRALRESLLRSSTSREIQLARLDAADVRTLLAVRLQGDPPPRALELIIGHSRGVPLFVEALVRWLLETGRLVDRTGRWEMVSEGTTRVPPLIRDVIAGRLERLRKRDRETLELIAVAGEARPDVLARVAPQRLDSSLSSLLRAGLVVREASGNAFAYRLEHPLVLEVAYEEIPEPRRARLHLELARALEGSGDVSAQAAHYLAAGSDAEGGQAADVLLAAGCSSLERCADEQALRFFEAALRHAEVTRPELMEQVLSGAGEASFRLGRLSDAARIWRSMLDRGLVAGDPVRRARVHRLIATAESERGAYEAAEHELHAGLAVLGATPSEERVELLFLEGATTARRMSDEDDATRRLSDRIQDAAALVDTPRARVLTGIVRVVAPLHRGDYAAAFEAVKEVAGPARTLRDPVLLRRVYDLRAMLAATLGDLPAARAANAESLDLGRRVGVPGWDYRLYSNQFLEAFLSGEWDRAWEVCREAQVAIEKVDNPRTVPTVFAMEAVLAAFQGDFEAAVGRLKVGRSFLAEGPGATAPGGISLDLAAAVVALEQERPREALAVLAPYEPSLAAHFPPWSVIALAEARARSGQSSAARSLIDRLARTAPEGSFPAVMAVRLVGVTELSAGDPAEAMGYLLRSRDEFRRLGMPFEEARATIEAGEAMARASSRFLGGFAADLSGAHERAARLGARRYEERAAVLLRTAGARVPAWHAPAKTTLTARQLEVAELVAKGLSNAEIAEQLFVSVRTVTSHLDHIYTRLGIASRAALATHVTELRHAGEPLRPRSGIT